MLRLERKINTLEKVVRTIARSILFLLSCKNAAVYCPFTYSAVINVLGLNWIQKSDSFRDRP